MSKIVVIITAAGSGTRFGGEIKKQFAILGKNPVLAHTLQRFQNHPEIDEIYITAPAEDLIRCETMAMEYRMNKVKKVLQGGDSRYKSVSRAVEALDCEADDIVLIHDGVRPCVMSNNISDVCDAIKKYNAALLAVPLNDSLKFADEDDFAKSRPREGLWLAQTPQGAKYGILKAAFDSLPEDAVFTDDASVLEQSGYKVKLVKGSADNIKITSKEDIFFAEAVLAAQKASKASIEQKEQKSIKNAQTQNDGLIRIYTDGSCLKNPGNGGYAAILIKGDLRKEISGAFSNTTNNRMELRAAIEGLLALKIDGSEVELYTDSQYLVNAFNKEWIFNWEKANFMLPKNGGKRENEDLWRALLKLTRKHKVKFIWVRGHNGHEFNEACDRMAKAAAAKEGLAPDNRDYMLFI